METKYPVGFVCRSPLVFRFFWYSDPPAEVEYISEMIPDEPAVFLISNAWSLLDRYARSTLKPTLDKFKGITAKRRHHRIIILGNDHAETSLALSLDVDAVVGSHNMFIDIQRFSILADVEKKYDAVYNGRISAYKRCELISEIKSVCVISASIDQSYLARIWDLLAHAVFANGDPRQAPSYLSPTAVNTCYNQSRVGLCLSAVEGGMLSAAEYLLSGIPVVSTHNIGGRDTMLDGQNSLIVDSSSANIAEAVRSMIDRKISPFAIRSAALTRMLQMRAALSGKVTELMRDDWSNEQRSRIETMMLDLNNLFPTPPRPMAEICSFIDGS